MCPAPEPLTVVDRVGNRYVNEPTPINVENLDELDAKYNS